MKRLLQLTAAIFIFCNIVFAQAENKKHSQTDREEQELIRLENETVTATDKRDFAMLNLLIADDFAGTTSKGVLRNKAETIASWTNNAPKNAQGEMITTSVATTLNEMRVRLSGKTAIVTGLDRAVFKNKDGSETKSEARFTDIWEKRKIGWQMIAGHASRIPQTDSPASGAAATNLEQEFKQLLQDKYDGKRANDKDFIERTTAETRVFVNEKGDISRRTKAEVLAAASKPSPISEIPDEAKPKLTVEDVNVQLYGEVAVVQYRLDMRMIFNQEPVLKQFRRTEVFNRKAGVWQYVAGQETVIPGEIAAVKVDPKIYDDYVGQYQLFKGYIYTITRQGDKLMFNSRAVGDKELMPETETSFVEKGLLYRVIFVRNDKGEITHLRLREFPGVEYNAIKIK